LNLNLLKLGPNHKGSLKEIHTWWPTQRAENEPNYVGTSGDQITLAKDGQCPEKCRPQYHEDWTLC